MSDNPWGNSGKSGNSKGSSNRESGNRSSKPSSRSRDNDGDRRAGERGGQAWKKSDSKPSERSEGRNRPNRPTKRSDSDGGQRYSYPKKRRDNDSRFKPRDEKGSSFKRRDRGGYSEDDHKDIAEEKPRNPLTTERKKGLPEVDAEGVIETQGERLQKVLANHDFGSRRDIEKLMLEGDVLVNGDAATLGMRVLGGEEILIKGKAFTIPSVGANETEVLVYHKPVGQICSREDEKGRVTVFECIPKPKTGRWVMIGRLDINTSGLLIFTNNGALANTMMHPSNEVLRRYRVRVFGDLASNATEQLIAGVQLDDGPAKFEECEFVAGRANNRWYNVSLREGRNREVRRMWVAVGGTVSRLIRVAYGPITLAESLKHGESRWATKSEMQELSTLAGFDMSDSVIGDGSVHKIEPAEREERSSRGDSSRRPYSKDASYRDRGSRENKGGRDRRDSGPKRGDRNARSGESRSGESRSGESRSGESRSGDSRSNEGRRGGRPDARSGSKEGYRSKGRPKDRFADTKGSPYKKRD